MATLQCYFLGHPRIEQDQCVLHFPRRKAQALFIYLAVTGEPQARETLAALLWPERDDHHAFGSLRRHLSELNTILGRGWIEATHDTVRLAPTADIWLDITDFTQQLAACRRHDHAPDRVCPACIAPLTAAVARYHADFLTGFTLPDAPAFDEWQFFQAEALRRQLGDALDRLTQAYVAQNEAALAISYARRRLSLDPLHEAVHRQLMQLYAATGQQAAALRQYTECVRLLDTELGVAPAEETTTLYTRMRRGDAPQGTKAARATQLALRHNLPAQTTPFIGRAREVAELRQLCRDPTRRLVTILGPGGIGKTRLALEVAAHLVADVPHGVFLVHLSPLGDAEHMVPAIADALAFQFHADGRSAKQQLLAYLSQKETLLVLDNFEHLLAGVDLLQELLQDCPRLRLLVTSRERLQLMSETVFTLGGMDFPTWETPDDTQEYSAVQLFLQRAQRICPNLAFHTDDIQYIARICRLVGGVPLGIILAATWVEVLTPAAIAAELTHGFDLLETQLRDLPQRQRSMRAVLAYSWYRLDAIERDVFMRLTVFRGGFKRDAAQMVAGATLHTLARLVDKSFLQHTAHSRYTIHELLRQYGEKQVEEAGEMPRTCAAHSAYYLEFLHQCELGLAGTDQLAVIAELEADFENIRSAWQWAVQTHNYTLVDRALDGLFRWFWLRRSRQQEGLALLQLAEEHWRPDSEQDPHPVWGRILARIQEQQGPWLLYGTTVQERVEQALFIARQQNNRAEIAFCTWALAFAIVSQRRDTPFTEYLQPAIALYTQSLDYYRNQDQFWQAQVLEHLGHCYRIMGKFKPAVAALQESLTLRRDLIDRFGLARSWRELGFAAFMQGVEKETDKAWQMARTIQYELGDGQGIAWLFILLLILLLAVPMRTMAPVKAALYWFASVRDKTITVCFVGDAVTARPDRVQQILAYLAEFEYVANVKFNYLGRCSSPTAQPDGDDYHDGDIRVVIPNISVSGSGPVPGNGCPMFNQQGSGGYDGGNDGWGSWSNAPNDLDANRPCLYNLKLGDDPWNDTPYLNHTLHEFGHALGLSHEHQRLDAACYDPNIDTRFADQGYMTPYDVDSVMHYAFSTAAGHTCDTPGNYGNAGLSPWDKLALHILYPEDNRVAEFVGTTVIRTTDTLNLQSAWKMRGANLAFVANNFVWKLNGNTVSTTPELVTTFANPGEYTLELTHSDFLGRTYGYTGVIRVLTPAAYDQLMAGVAALNQALLTQAGPTTHAVPTSGGSFVLYPTASLTITQDAFAATTVIRYTPQAVRDTGNLADVGIFYDLEAVDPLEGAAMQLQPSKTYAIAVTYQEASIPTGVEEADLALYYWADAAGQTMEGGAGRWIREETSTVDLATNTVSASPNHFSVWAVLAETQHSIYLPLVVN